MNNASAHSSTTDDEHVRSHTIRGRAPDVTQDVPAATGKNKPSLPFGTPQLNRTRANSLRRLNTEALQQLAESTDALTKFGAQREQDVRKGLLLQSQAQFSSSSQPHMAARHPAGMPEVNALRFTASMAEEAQTELQQTDKWKKRKIGQVGIANVNGHLGFGISGKIEANDLIEAVQARMLELQQAYDQIGGSAKWSSRLVPVQVPEVASPSAETLFKDICAAKRASLTAHVAAGLMSPDVQPQRSDIPSPDMLLEAMQTATSDHGKNIDSFSSPLPAGHIEPNPQPFETTISGRARSQSLSSMANSCQYCMAEHEVDMARRDKGGHFK
ncbi:hypothetical protein [Herbaspirillum rubrisubalbicans]|uniref:Uncharacterized protein n=1 Tax=Herbaspirillum rubrisubalbicans TaxID=80842 RepID=A0AAD0U790_9BURK|nr:hypothetical protein [Herbaspirillum rubrisubalbicans]AYR24587.1 hypothetical protein RC54_12485 [Herbaspirillum rubrisubalbicans]